MFFDQKSIYRRFILQLIKDLQDYHNVLKKISFFLKLP